MSNQRVIRIGPCDGCFEKSGDPNGSLCNKCTRTNSEEDDKSDKYITYSKGSVPDTTAHIEYMNKKKRFRF